MDVTFERLRNIYRMESSTSMLTRLEPDFYEKLSEFMEKESEKLKEYLENQDVRGLNRFANIRKLVSQIVQLRVRKVITLASDPDAEPENLVGWESELFEKIRGIAGKYLSGFEALSEREEKTVRVRFLDSVPRFVGTDYKEYGPYEKGDSAEIPKEVAEILVLRGIAEVIE